jgi:hypothetical protein
MRIVLVLLLIISLSFAQNITYFLNLSAEIICPDNILVMTAHSSGGNTVPGIELRLVLHSPYQGLRAVQTTNSSGQASAELTKPGLYRVYMKSENYNHPDFVSFNYSEMCPPLPPKNFSINVTPDCNNSLLIITAEHEGMPLEDVFIRTLNWSSFSSPAGMVAFPFEEGYVYIQANKTGYFKHAFWTNVSCKPPEPEPEPECLENSSCLFNQFCSNQTCVNITGTCGHAENHSWISYECCEDNDCGYKMICTNNSCILEPPPEINVTENVSLEDEPVKQEQPEQIPLWSIPIVLILIAILIFFALKKKS